MKTISIVILCAALASASFAVSAKGSRSSTKLYTGNSHHVSGYMKKDGTYVAPHQSTNPNGTQADNWSSKGNTNPYTGKKGTKEATK